MTDALDRIRERQQRREMLEVASEEGTPLLAELG